jgi:cation transport ATPase
VRVLKKITLSIDGCVDEQDAKKIASSINDLSGVVAADVVASESMAYAYAGDKLDSNTVSNSVSKAGFTAHVLKDEYSTDNTNPIG